MTGKPLKNFFKNHLGKSKFQKEGIKRLIIDAKHLNKWGYIFLTILLTRVHVQVHFSNQDVNPACNGLHRIMRNSLCNDVTVPRYVLLPGSKKTPSSNNKNYKQSYMWCLIYISNDKNTRPIIKHLPVDPFNKQALLIVL